VCADGCTKKGKGRSDKERKSLKKGLSGATSPKELPQQRKVSGGGVEEEGV